MLCRKPFIQGMQAFPCGRCMPCLRQRKRQWTHRILLEASLRQDNAFVTLTYAEPLPANASLQKKHYQDWLKRLRFSMAPLRFRYFVVGEYGDEGGRPHYHAALFGFPTCRSGATKRNIRGKPTPELCCGVCRLLHTTWGHGIVDVGSITTASAQYISGYVTKKMTHRHHPWLEGRDPEFARMSLKPGLGYDFLHEIASTMMQFNLELSEADVPVSLAHGKKQLPLGRYLRKNLRKLIGRDEKAPAHVTDQLSQEMRYVYQNMLETKSHTYIGEALSAVDDGKVAAAEARAKIFKKRTSL